MECEDCRENVITAQENHAKMNSVNLPLAIGFVVVCGLIAGYLGNKSDTVKIARIKKIAATEQEVNANKGAISPVHFRVDLCKSGVSMPFFWQAAQDQTYRDTHCYPAVLADTKVAVVMNDLKGIDTIDTNGQKTKDSPIDIPKDKEVQVVFVGDSLVRVKAEVGGKTKGSAVFWDLPIDELSPKVAASLGTVPAPLPAKTL